MVELEAVLLLHLLPDLLHKVQIPKGADGVRAADRHAVHVLAFSPQLAAKVAHELV